jgi:hypothetical protein
VKRNIPTPVDLKIFDLLIFQTLLVQLEVIFVPTLTQREYRGMLTEEEVLFLGFRIAGTLVGYKLLMQPGL